MSNKRPITNPAIAEMEQRSAREIEYAVDRAEFGNYVQRQLKAIEARKVLVNDMLTKVNQARVVMDIRFFVI